MAKATGKNYCLWHWPCLSPQVRIYYYFFVNLKKMKGMCQVTRTQRTIQPQVQLVFFIIHSWKLASGPPAVTVRNLPRKSQANILKVGSKVFPSFKANVFRDKSRFLHDFCFEHHNYAHSNEVNKDINIGPNNSPCLLLSVQLIGDFQLESKVCTIFWLTLSYLQLEDVASKILPTILTHALINVVSRANKKWGKALWVE